MKLFLAVVVLWLLVEGYNGKIPNFIPSPKELLQLQKQILLGLPELAILEAASLYCSAYLESGLINPRIIPDEEKLAFHLRTPCRDISFPLKQADQILKSSEFDVKKKVVIFVHGWMVDLEKDYVLAMADAYNCRGDYNFLALNIANSIKTLYTWSAYNTQEVGRQMALAIINLLEEVPIGNIHLVGHSLGAHIAGYAGRYLNELTGLILPRITGLDPANPCFNEGHSLSGIQRGDAAFIDIMHTNPGGFGKAEPLGDADFYVEGLAPIQPGCIKLGCSHERALWYYMESVYPGNEENFLAARCSSMANFNKNYCSESKYPMGFATPYNLKGNYYLSVNAKSPYGKNNDASKRIPSNCGQCK